MAGSFDFDVVTGPSGADAPRACALTGSRADKPAPTWATAPAAQVPAERRRELFDAVPALGG